MIFLKPAGSRLWSATGMVVVLSAPIYLLFQNCVGSNTSLDFSKARNSLASVGANQNGGTGYDGKPDPGSYCRVSDELTCLPAVSGLQSLLQVDADGLHLIQDNCASTATNFLPGDVAVTYSALLPDFIGVSRGIFKKCEVDANKQPLPAKDMADAYCVSENRQVVAVISKDLQTSELSLQLNYSVGPEIRSVTTPQISKLIGSQGDLVYSSTSKEFDLAIKRSSSQTATGVMHVAIDDSEMSVNLNCRTSNPLPTVIIENDMELSSTWIDTSELVGYWKLNEPSATEGTVIVDSSAFAASGFLSTGNDGLVKSDASVKSGAIALDGTNDYIRIPGPADGRFDFGLRSFSYMVWIKKTENKTPFDMPFFSGGGQNVDPGFDIECGTSCYAGVSDGAGSAQSVAIARFSPGGAPTFVGQWTLLLVVIDRSNQQLRAYVDGKVVATSDISRLGSVSRVNNRDVYFGQATNGQHHFFGSLDDVAIFNRALSDSEILEIYQRLRPKFF